VVEPLAAAEFQEPESLQRQGAEDGPVAGVGVVTRNLEDQPELLHAARRPVGEQDVHQVHVARHDGAVLLAPVPVQEIIHLLAAARLEAQS
jgi:hypothetical protein